ncbi:hypothetical protein [Candidatus Palauibacter sp.]|uniref:hypothetical protein n=1 Tax=Candidatus Palauibacter sp. TaxID=3101350 RepID=UPI003AF2C4B9
MPPRISSFDSRFHLRRVGTPAAIGILLAGFLLGLSGLLPTPEFSVRWRTRSAGELEYQPARRIDEGDELVLTAIVSSNCYWSNLPEVKRAIREAKLLLSRRAEEEGIGFAAVGVARDLSAEAGIAHLRKHGLFDEVRAGRGWYNSGVMEFIYGDFAGPAITPQLVIMTQRVSFQAGERRMAERIVLTRKLGSDAIVNWVDAGAPLPE